jgi:iron-sulfur cluster assembly protein
MSKPKNFEEYFMNEPIIHFTQAAIEYINKVILSRGHGLGFRLTVKQAGCTGYKYQPEIVDEVSANDQEWLTPEGLRVFLDPQYLSMLKGTQVDLVNKGPGQSQLIFQNPNSESECGCGESFFLKDIKAKTAE